MVLTHMAVSHHALGDALETLPHDRHQLVQLLHGEGDVVLVSVALVRQRLCDALAQRPQSLKQEITV